MRELKDKIICLSEDHCEYRLLTMEFDLFDHQCDDLRKFPTLQVLEAAPYEHFNFVIKSGLQEFFEKSD